MKYYKHYILLHDYTVRGTYIKLYNIVIETKILCLLLFFKFTYKLLFL